MTKSALLALGATVALCGCHQGTASQRGTTASATDTGGTPVTLIGCLVPGGAGASTAPVGTSGNTAATGFTLIDVTTTSTPSVSETPGTPGTSGTSGTPGTAASARTGSAAVDTGTPRSYDLVGDRNRDDLQKYQNSKVEVSGFVVASTDTGAGVPDVGAASTPAGTPATDVQRVRVDHVRQLDKTCNATKR